MNVAQELTIATRARPVRTLWEALPVLAKTDIAAMARCVEMLTSAVMFLIAAKRKTPSAPTYPEVTRARVNRATETKQGLREFQSV